MEMVSTTKGFKCTFSPVNDFRIEKVSPKQYENFIQERGVFPKLKRASLYAGVMMTPLFIPNIVQAEEHQDGFKEIPQVITAMAMAPQKVVIPKEVDEVLFYIQLGAVLISVSVATLMGMVAGFFRIIGLREEAKKRYQDAIAGMVQVLTAPLVFGIIATIVRGILRLLPEGYYIG